MAGNGWVSLRLGDVCEKIGSGATPRGGSKVYLEQGAVTLIRSQNIYNNEFAHNGLVYITPEHAEQLASVEVLPNDVLLNITGDSVARCCQVDPSVLPARVNQHVVGSGLRRWNIRQHRGPVFEALKDLFHLGLIDSAQRSRH